MCLSVIVPIPSQRGWSHRMFEGGLGCGSIERLNGLIKKVMENETPVQPENEVVTGSQVSDTKCQCLSEKKSMKEALLLSGAILLGSLIISGSILSLVPMKSSQVAAKPADTVAPTGGEEMPTNVTVSIDDDAILGDKGKAKVAIVEFTDYECPFCKRFHADTFDTLVKEYVDTGKAIIVTRDYPLSFHDPKATEAAAIAECVRKEKGDVAYFAFAKGYYQGTQTNGKGFLAGKVEALIGKTGANVKSVTACAETDAVRAEITKDINDGTAVGISGTPSFVIGTLDASGNVTGERVVGALQTDGFKSKIDMYLSK